MFLFFAGTGGGTWAGLSWARERREGGGGGRKEGRRGFCYACQRGLFFVFWRLSRTSILFLLGLRRYGLLCTRKLRGEFSSMSRFFGSLPPPRPISNKCVCRYSRTCMSGACGCSAIFSAKLHPPLRSPRLIFSPTTTATRRFPTNKLPTPHPLRGDANPLRRRPGVLRGHQGGLRGQEQQGRIVAAAGDRDLAAGEGGR